MIGCCGAKGIAFRHPGDFSYDVPIHRYVDKDVFEYQSLSVRIVLMADMA